MSMSMNFVNEDQIDAVMERAAEATKVADRRSDVHTITIVCNDGTWEATVESTSRDDAMDDLSVTVPLT